MAESFVDSYKTELIADRVWRSRAQVELGTVDYVAWFNHERLHSSLGDIPPVEFEAAAALDHAISGNGSIAGDSPRAADGLTTSRVATIGVDFAAQPSDLSVSAPAARNGFAQAAPTAVKGRNASVGLSNPPGQRHTD